MNNGYRLEDISQTIAEKLNISPLTIRGYLYGKASVFNDPDVIKRLREAGLDGPVRQKASRKKSTTTAGARKKATAGAKKAPKAAQRKIA